MFYVKVDYFPASKHAPKLNWNTSKVNIYLFYTPRTLNKISKEWKGHCEIRKTNLSVEEKKTFQKGHKLREKGRDMSSQDDYCSVSVDVVLTIT